MRGDVDSLGRLGKMVSGAFGRVGMRCIVAGDVLFSCWTLHALTIKLLKQRNVRSLVLTEKRHLLW